MGAHKYANLIARLLASCEFLDPPPAYPSEIKIPRDNPNSFYWKDKLSFRDGKVLSILDIATFDVEGNMLERSFKYDFRDASTRKLHFRICNHCGTPQLITEPCHVHVGSEETVKHFLTSEGKDFSYTIHCIKNFYSEKLQDWEMEVDDEQIA